MYSEHEDYNEVYEPEELDDLYDEQGMEELSEYSIHDVYWE